MEPEWERIAQLSFHTIENKKSFRDYRRYLNLYGTVARGNPRHGRKKNQIRLISGGGGEIPVQNIVLFTRKIEIRDLKRPTG